MKKHVILFSIILSIFLASHTVYAQDDAKITIKVNGKDVELEAYFEKMGDHIEEAIEKMCDEKTKIEINIDDEDWETRLENLDVKINITADNFEDMIESFAHQIEDAVTHMDIELHDVDPDHIDNDMSVNDSDFRDWIDEIEDRYNSRVDNIDYLKLKIRKDGVYANMDVTLTNGKEIHNLKNYFED